jgi:hypothetical protein
MLCWQRRQSAGIAATAESAPPAEPDPFRHLYALHAERKIGAIKGAGADSPWSAGVALSWRGLAESGDRSSLAGVCWPAWSGASSAVHNLVQANIGWRWSTAFFSRERSPVCRVIAIVAIDSVDNLSGLDAV